MGQGMEVTFITVCIQGLWKLFHGGYKLRPFCGFMAGEKCFMSRILCNLKNKKAINGIGCCVADMARLYACIVCQFEFYVILKRDI